MPLSSRYFALRFEQRGILYSLSAEDGVYVGGETSSVRMSPYDAGSNAPVTAEFSKDREQKDVFSYKNAFGTDTTVKYSTTYTGVKEDIILEKNTGKNRFDFQLEAKGGIPRLSEDGKSIDVVDPDDEILYHVSSIYIYDSFKEKHPELFSEPEETTEKNGAGSELTVFSGSDIIREENSLSDYEISSDSVSSDPGLPEEKAAYRHTNEDGYYELTRTGVDSYLVTVVVPREYLNHPETVYPVVIDPTVTAVSSAYNIDDTYAVQGNGANIIWRQICVSGITADAITAISGSTPCPRFRPAPR